RCPGRSAYFARKKFTRITSSQPSQRNAQQTNTRIDNQLTMLVLVFRGSHSTYASLLCPNSSELALYFELGIVPRKSWYTALDSSCGLMRRCDDKRSFRVATDGVVSNDELSGSNTFLCGIIT